MEQLEETIFYTLEKSIKTYRQFAQRNLLKQGYDITIDQWLVLETISRHEDINREQISEKVFKDAASVTRIMDLLVEKKYLKKDNHPEDSRRFFWKITSSGSSLLKTIEKTVIKNRMQALKGISEQKIIQLKNQLDLIIENCKNEE